MRVDPFPNQILVYQILVCCTRCFPIARTPSAIRIRRSIRPAHNLTACRKSAPNRPFYWGSSGGHGLRKMGGIPPQLRRSRINALEIAVATTHFVTAGVRRSGYGQMTHINHSSQWRKRAKEIRDLAYDLRDADSRRTILKLSEEYDRLAEMAREWPAETPASRPR